MGPSNAPANVQLAAKRIRRYVYLRTRELLPVAQPGRNGIILKVDPSPRAARLHAAKSS